MCRTSGATCRTPVAKVSIKNTFWEAIIVDEEAAQGVAGDGLRRSSSCPSLRTSIGEDTDGEDVGGDDSSAYSLYMSDSWADLSEPGAEDQFGTWQRSGRPTGQAERATQADELVQKKPSAAPAAAGERVEEEKKKPAQTALRASVRPWDASCHGTASTSPWQQQQPGRYPLSLFPHVQMHQACIGLPLGFSAPEAPACRAGGSTLMMKDLPTYYTEDMLMGVLMLKGVAGRCVSMYLPILTSLREGAMQRNMGIAMLDFATPEDAAFARAALHGHVWAGSVDNEDRELKAEVADAAVRASACKAHFGADGAGADQTLDWLDLPALRQAQAWPPACCRESTPSLSPERMRPAAYWPQPHLDWRAVA